MRRSRPKRITLEALQDFIATSPAIMSSDDMEGDTNRAWMREVKLDEAAARHKAQQEARCQEPTTLKHDLDRWTDVWVKERGAPDPPPVSSRCEREHESSQAPERDSGWDSGHAAGSGAVPRRWTLDYWTCFGLGGR